MPRLFPRHSLPAIFTVLLTALAVRANPKTNDPDAGVQNTLAVQRALEQARFHLFEKADARKAVEILEDHLPRINGNAIYLRLLRDAYRTYIKDLLLVRQGGLARKYLERLAILDRDALNDPLLNAGAEDLAATAIKSPAQKPATVRAKVDDDPFDAVHQLQPGAAARQNQQSETARQLLARAENEFSQRNYGQAMLLYEKAHDADPATVTPSRQRWAYCKLNRVFEQLKQPKLDGQSLPTLRREAQLAMDMAPNLAETGKWLLQEIEQRGQARSGTGADGSKPAVQHLGNIQDWQVAETANFRIFHKHSRELAEKVAAVAERTRLEMHRKWFGGDGPAWNSKCDLYLHATAKEYTRITGVAGHSPGHSRIESDTMGRVLARRLDLHCDVPTMLEAVLPHETTHVVLAGQFGRHHVPRWADEGMAVLSEPRDKIEQHRRNMLRNQREGQLFQVRDLMSLQEYPNPRKIGPFYAQSVVLVEFLSAERGPQVFAQFVREGLDRGYEAALQKYYGYRNFNELQTRWDQHLRAEVEKTGAAVAGR